MYFSAGSHCFGDFVLIGFAKNVYLAPFFSLVKASGRKTLQ